MKRLIVIVVMMSSMFGAGLKAQMLALKTDALWDCALTPNLTAELVTGGKTSLCISVFGNRKPWGLDMKMLGVIPEFRYWFNGRPMVREFIGIAPVVAGYDITWDNEVYKGDAYGAGLTFGYAFCLSTRWNLELHAGVGCVYYDHKHYYVTDMYTENRRTAHGYSFIPYKVGVSFAYIIR